MDHHNLFVLSRQPSFEPTFSLPTSSLGPGTTSISSKLQRVYFKKQLFKMKGISNHEKETLKEHPEFERMSSDNDVVVIVINGNHGSSDQFPLIWQSLEQYFTQVHLQQAHEDYDTVMERIFGDRQQVWTRQGKGKTVHLRPKIYGFDINMQP